MGVMGTIVGFGAGYALGANRSAAPVKRAEGMIRDAVAQRVPGPLKSIGTAEARQVREVMTPMPQTVSLETSITDAARMMAEEGIGDVIVVEQDTQRVVGIVTDRDIAIRAVAKGMGPSTEVGDVYSRDLVALERTSTVREALDLMRDLNVRRLPVVEHDRALGVVSLGDLSGEADAGPALADISAASPDR
jgi:signal-transduction protein with cAMP-binding, CBS, and nucleotidyltransferase domain